MHEGLHQSELLVVAVRELADPPQQIDLEPFGQVADLAPVDPPRNEANVSRYSRPVSRSYNPNSPGT